MVIEQWFIYLAHSAYTSDLIDGHPTGTDAFSTQEAEASNCHSMQIPKLENCEKPIKQLRHN